MHVVGALDRLLVLEALAPGLAVVAEEGERGLLAQPERVELLEEAGEIAPPTSARPPRRYDSRSAASAEALSDWMPAMISSFAASHSLRVGVEDVVGHVRRPAVEPEHERPVPVLAQPLDGAVERLARAGDVRVGEALEQVVLVEDEAAASRSRAPPRR